MPNKYHGEDNTFTYVGYGVGHYYSIVNKEVKRNIRLSYLYDKKWDASDLRMYDGIPIISKAQLKSVKDLKVVIFSNDSTVQASIISDLQKIGADFIFADSLIGRRILTGEIVKKEGSGGVWEDVCDNRIYFDETLPDQVQITLRGKENRVRFGKNIFVGKLQIILGNCGECVIGDHAKFIDTQINAAYASVRIGADCLFSSNVVIRTHDEHYIFDKDSLERLNRPLDVIIHPQVWVCENVRLLPGAYIGTGSVVGADAVTSGQFGEHLILAGVPAKVIRENICWSKDSTACTNFERLDECTCKDALKYF
ncbi:MAG: acyltransferase [Eubacterium sp.]|nr:acyltransferase [Eubacterium sp.]